MPGLVRFEKEQRYLRTMRALLLAEKEKRKQSPEVQWARSYAGRPVEFLGEIIGQEWWTDAWRAWRVLVAVAFGQNLTPAELLIFQEATGLQKPHPGRAKQIWAIVGRRGGKTRVFAAIAVHIAICYDWSPYLVPGERGLIPILSAGKERAKQCMGYVKAFFDHPKLRYFRERLLTEEIELRGNLTIRIQTSSIQAVRSNTIIALICDEVAFWRSDELGANPDKEILNSARPAMATIPGSLLLGASSPYARRGVLYEEWVKRFEPGHEDRLVWKASTLFMHPASSDSEADQKFREDIADEFKKDPISAEAEFGANFRSDVSSFVLREALDACIVPGLLERSWNKKYAYSGFVDPSGGMSDSMTIAIAHKDETDTAVLDLVREIRPLSDGPFSPLAAVVEFAGILKAYRVRTVVGDAYGGEILREQFRKEGIEYEVSEKVKSAIYQAWLPLVNSGRCELLDNERLVTQASRLERRVSRMGRDAIDHPPGEHDDLCNAAAGAVVLAYEQQTLRITDDLLSRVHQQWALRRAVQRARA